MSKTLVIAEKPSVGKDLSKVLPGPSLTVGEKRVLEGPEHIITWAVGHLVQLADPDEYDEKYAKWRMPDLPIVPKKFKLVVRDERSKQQMTAVTRELGRDDVDLVINACDAGREGELIFAYLYEKAGSKLPVQRLWLNSMTNAAIKDAFKSLRPSEEYHTLEEAARSRSEADWIVGMNATRAATIRCAPRLTARSRWAACRRRRSRSWRGVSRRSATSSRSPTGSSTPASWRYRRVRGAPMTAVTTSAPSRGSQRRRRPPRSSPPARGRPAPSPRSRRVRVATARLGCMTWTALQRDASSRFGFTASRTLRAAQRLYEEHKALTYRVPARASSPAT